MDGLGFGKSELLTKDNFYLTKSLNGHRSILVNHACDGNASRWADSDYMVSKIFDSKHNKINMYHICIMST